jgi:hypothetical protein
VEEPNENAPIVLTTIPSELIASILVGRLQNEGIRAELAGVYTASFRVEAPGHVQILVLQQDEERARYLLARWENERESSEDSTESSDV